MNRNNAIKTITKYILNWRKNIIQLPSIKINKFVIKYNSILYFNITSSRSTNDISNKNREVIISSIINNDIDDKYYLYSRLWRNLKKEIDMFIKRVLEKNNIIIKSSIHYKCIIKGGRKYKYDFDLVIFDNSNIVTTIFIEFKYNSINIKNTPQFVSPMHPSNYLSSSYEEYFYYNYLDKIYNLIGLIKPPINEYLKEVSKSEPNNINMKKCQIKYYAGCSRSSKFTNNNDDILFYKKCKEISKQSIYEFIKITKLNTIKLQEYLTNTQKNKVYMLFYNKKIYNETNMIDFKIKYIISSPKKSSYICITKSNYKIKILMRWKNGNGIQFPAFQIS